MRKNRFCLLAVCLLSSTALAEDGFITLTDQKGRSIEARIVTLTDEDAVVQRKGQTRTFSIKLEDLSEESIDLIDNHRMNPGDPGAGKDDNPKDDVKGPAKGEHVWYPMSKDELKAAIKTIRSVKRPDDVGKAEFAAVQRLNEYRLHAGVPWDVAADAGLCAAATDAAKACAEAGELSHDLGRFTDKCNLWHGTDPAKWLVWMVEDIGTNNKNDRGHRKWCLDPRLAKTGLGTDGAKYSALHVAERTRPWARDFWAYPGIGYVPLEYLHGEMWSLWIPFGPPPVDQLKVEVFKLSKVPENGTEIPWEDEVPGRPLAVPKVTTYQNAINFVPEEEPITRRGRYLVRVRGGSLKIQYLVDLI